MSCFSIFTGWTMSRTLIFFGWIWTSLGLDEPLGGGGGGGGGGTIARSATFLSLSSYSISQIDFAHIVMNKITWKTATEISSGAAHFGALYCLAAL